MKSTQGIRAHGWFQWGAFTLIELLVTIVIIGILASMLLPTLASAKRRAARSRCVSNLKQVGVAFIGFSHDNQSRLPWQLGATAQANQGLVGNATRNSEFFSIRAIKHSLGTAAVIVSPSDPERHANNVNAQNNWPVYTPANPIPCNALSYHLAAGSDIGRPTTVLAATRNLSILDLAFARWLGADSDTGNPNAMAGLNRNEGQLLLADGSASKSGDADLGATGLIVQRHINTSGGITKGPANTRLFDCDSGPGFAAAAGGPAAPAPVVNGLLGTYYTGSNWDGTSATRTDATLNLPFGNAEFFGVAYSIPLPGASAGSPRPLWTAKWVGQIKADATGTYTFHTNVDNFGWVFVDGKQVAYVAQGWGWQHYVPSTPVMLEAGKWVDFEVRFKEEGPGSPSWIRVQWSSGAMAQCDISSANLRLK